MRRCDCASAAMTMPYMINSAPTKIRNPNSSFTPAMPSGSGFFSRKIHDIQNIAVRKVVNVDDVAHLERDFVVPASVEAAGVLIPFVLVFERDTVMGFAVFRAGADGHDVGGAVLASLGQSRFELLGGRHFAALRLRERRDDYL